MSRIAAYLLIAMASAGAIVMARKNADIMVSYEYRFPAFGGGERTEKMTLLANAEESKYFNDLSLWIDSLQSTPEGKARYEEIIRANCLVRHPDGYDYWDFTKGPVKKVYTFIFNNSAEEKLAVYDRWGDETMFYTEPSGEIEWSLNPDSTAIVVGYDCLMAETDYHGRHWKVWFAPEIPVGFGPWKLRGLPGLILKAEADGGFSFLATGLQATERLISPIYSPDDYKATERLKALANHEYFVNNQEAIIKAQNGGEGKISYQDENGNAIEQPEYDGRKLSLEPDYK